MQSPEKLTFAWLDKRLRAIPDGPTDYLNTPSGLVVWNAIGVIGIAVGLAPVALRQFMPVEPWMVLVAFTGLALEIVGLFPGFFYSTLAVVRSFRRWRTEFVQQLDHDIDQFRMVAGELSQFSDVVLAEHLRFVRDARSRLTIKFAFLFGGIDRLGILPVAIAIAMQIKLVGDLSAIPGWLAVLTLFCGILYFLALLASQYQIRLQLYEMVLARAADQKNTDACEITS